MRLTVVGCAGSFPRDDSACSSYLVEADGFRLLLDLGNGALSALQRHVSLYDIDAVFLSHLHADHCLDMCSYVVARRYAPDGPAPRIPVYGPADTPDRLRRAYDVGGGARRPSGRDGEPTGLRDVFDFVTLRPGTMDVGPFRMTAQRVNHPVETFGTRLECDGRVLAYSADTGASDALVSLARDADLLLCEATYLHEDPRPPDLHLTGREAGEHAARAGVGQLLLTHITAWGDERRALAEARDVFAGPLEAARPDHRHDL